MSYKVVLTIAILVVLVLAAILIGVSVQTVEYYQFGLIRVRSTGVVYKDVYHSTRVIKGPDRGFVTYPSTAQFVDLKLSALSADNLAVSFDIRFQYFLRREDLYQLYRTHKYDYDEVIRKIAQDSIKDSSTQYTIAQYIEDRPHIRSAFFDSLRRKLEGTCCLKDCVSKIRKCLPGCITGAKSNCSQGLYVEIRYFQFGSVQFHESILGPRLDALILTEDKIRKDYEQNATLVREEIEVKLKKLKNQANEIRQKSNAEAALIRKTADADYIKIVENARSSGLENLYSNLSFTDPQMKASFDYLRTLQRSRHVHLSAGFDQYISGSWKNK